MKKRIYISFLGLLLLFAMFVALLFGSFYSNAFNPEARDGFPETFAAALLLALFAAALSLPVVNFFSRKITESIIRPLSGDNPGDENDAVYEELLPYIKQVNRQKRALMEQAAIIKDRADTIAAITENMREGLLLLDSSGTVLSANKSIGIIFGETLRKNITHVCRDIDFQRRVRQSFFGHSAEMLFPRGSKTYNVFFSPVLNDAGKSYGSIILFLDVTARQEAERQRRQFSANVSHELKTPLTSISALSEMIATGMAGEDNIKNFAAKISGQAARLINIIEDMIKLSEFDEGGPQSELSDFDLYELAESVAEAFSINAKTVKISVCGERFNVKANRLMIDELLYNLIDNGIKYNQENGSVTVTLNKKENFCEISVSDTGIGIPEEHHNRVFERFYRVDKSRSKKTGGTGLGLSIVKHIAEYHGGSVEIQSEPDKGTTITCYIPI